ncbi:MAG: hypothetical protein RL219_1921 [Actinomycetota bacterium]|jgi:hypothetical protein
MGDGASGPEVSILLEVDNVRRKGTARALQSLTALAAEVSATDRDVEVLVGCPGDTADAWFHHLLRQSTLDTTGPRPVRVVPTESRRYYAVKNQLADRAAGDILVFTDADVIAQSGWLDALLAPLRDEHVSVTCGHTVVGPPVGTYARAMSACWIFDPTPQPGVSPRSTFHANSVAFRRSTFLERHFPERPDEYRGACARLAAELQRDGITVWLAGDAVTMHPPLAGMRDFVSSGLLSGHSWALRRAEEFGRGHWRRAVRWTGAGWRNTMLTVWQRRTICGLGPLGLVTAWVLGSALWVLRFAGLCVGRIRPGALVRFM